MAETVTMPKLGFDMAEGTLVRWVILEGEAVAKGSVLAEIETDKATVEVESPYDGLLARHLVKAGDIVPVNTPIAVVTAPGEKLAEASPTAPTPIADKPVEAPPVSEAQPATTPSTLSAMPESGQLPGGVKASPLAKRMAQEKGINLSLVKGSGPGGRIVKKDVASYVAAAATTEVVTTQGRTTEVVTTKAPTTGVVTTQIAEGGFLPSAPADRLVPVNRLRAAIGRRMVEAKLQAPHFYITHAVDMAGVMELRKQVNALLPDNEKTSVNDFIIKAVALALRQFPNLNASLQGEQVVQHGSVNIGVAVAIPGGLLTIVCREADRKPLRQIASEVRSMIARAREGKVRPEDIEGSTFSISNLGMFDVEHFIAIINPPEAAILAVGSVREIPVVKDGAIVPGVRMNATLSVDHRVSDGAEGAQFLQALGKILEEPLKLLI